MSPANSALDVSSSHLPPSGNIFIPSSPIYRVSAASNNNKINNNNIRNNKQNINNYTHRNSFAYAADHFHRDHFPHRPSYPNPEFGIRQYSDPDADLGPDHGLPTPSEGRVRSKSCTLAPLINSVSFDDTDFAQHNGLLHMRVGN